MRIRLRAFLVAVSMAALFGAPTLAQAPANPEDANIDAIRRLQQITGLDQDRIKNWVQAEVDSLAAFPRSERPDGFKPDAFRHFRQRFRDQLQNPENTPAFKTQLAVQTATVAAAVFARSSVDVTVGRSLARVLVEFDVPETLPGLLAGLAVPDAPTRYLCARGIAANRDDFAGVKETLDQVLAAIRRSAAQETDSLVLEQLYLSLNLPVAQAGPVFEIMLAAFDRRLNERRGTTLIADGAELPAYEFLRNRNVLGAMSNEQKAEFARRLAVFLRMNAERYNDPRIAPPADRNAYDANYYERDRLERMLDALEEILEAIVGQGRGGKIREVLADRGYEGKANVLAEAYRWVGNPSDQAPGALNDAPWNVPVGAP